MEPWAKTLKRFCMEKCQKFLETQAMIKKANRWNKVNSSGAGPWGTALSSPPVSAQCKCINVKHLFHSHICCELVCMILQNSAFLTPINGFHKNWSRLFKKHNNFRSIFLCFKGRWVGACLQHPFLGHVTDLDWQLCKLMWKSQCHLSNYLSDHFRCENAKKTNK